MTRFSYDQFRGQIGEGIEAHGLRPYARKLGVSVGVLRSIAEGRDISVSNLFRLCDAMGIDHAFSDGTPHFSTTPAPHVGFASLSMTGWGKAQPERDPLPLPLGVDDPDAFYVSGMGQSMEPEGIRGGDICLVSPARQIEEGDIVWLSSQDGETIKRLIKLDGDSFTLRGWQKKEDGQQKDFIDERVREYVQEIAPVIAVYRGRPGTDKAQLVAGMSAPQEAAGAIASEDFALVPLHDVQAAAGAGRLNTEGAPMSALSFSRKWLRNNGVNPSKASLLYVDGDSMEPTLPHRAMILINQNRTEVRPGRIYTFRTGSELRVKRLERLDDGSILATSDNNQYRPELAHTPKDPNADFEIIGEVVWYCRTLR